MSAVSTYQTIISSAVDRLTDQAWTGRLVVECEFRIEKRPGEMEDRSLARSPIFPRRVSGRHDRCGDFGRACRRHRRAAVCAVRRPGRLLAIARSSPIARAQVKVCTLPFQRSWRAIFHRGRSRPADASTIEASTREPEAPPPGGPLECRVIPGSGEWPAREERQHQPQAEPISIRPSMNCWAIGEDDPAAARLEGDCGRCDACWIGTGRPLSVADQPGSRYRPGRSRFGRFQIGLDRDAFREGPSSATPCAARHRRRSRRGGCWFLDDQAIAEPVLVAQLDEQGQRRPAACRRRRRAGPRSVPSAGPRDCAGGTRRADRVPGCLRLVLPRRGCGYRLRGQSPGTTGSTPSGLPKWK